jgi:hypothetical protein
MRSKCNKQQWLRKILKVSQRVEKKWEDPASDGWKMMRMIYENCK